MRRIVVFLFCFFIAGAVHAQNVLMVQGEWNFMTPETEAKKGPTWISGSLGTNLLLYKTLIQTDILISFGGIYAQKPSEEDAATEHDYWETNEFLFNVSDNIFVSLNTDIIGLRAGFSGGIGIYSGELIQFFLNIGFLVGIHILPESLISFAIDIKPGYTGTVHWDYGNSDFFKAFSPLQYGWTFPLALSVRLNLDKL